MLQLVNPFAEKKQLLIEGDDDDDGVAVAAFDNDYYSPLYHRRCSVADVDWSYFHKDNNFL